jgi:uncharacterized membrane protein
VRRGRDDRGVVIPIVALSLTFLMLMTAFTVDLGRLMVTSRQVQSVADVTSLDLVRQLDGRTVAQIQADPNWTTAVADTRARNNFSAGGNRTFVIETSSARGDDYTIDKQVVRAMAQTVILPG